jgi:NADH-quinone oxidoreductase subunit N
VVGSMISLGYYLPVIAAMWMREAPAAQALSSVAGGPDGLPAGALPVLAGGSPELDERPRSTQPEVLLVALVATAGTIFFGIVPQPLFNFVHHAGSALGGLF